MYFLTYHGQSKSESQENKDIGGAYINCWIESDDIHEADNIARQEIEQMSWNILSRDEACEINRTDYKDNDEGLRNYEQALIDKIVYVFHIYPIDEEG